jgi:hypothetical protein
MAQHGGGFAQWYLQNNLYVMSASSSDGFVCLLMWITSMMMLATTYAQTCAACVIRATPKKPQEIDEREKITRSRAPRTDCSPSRTRAQSKIWGKL